MQEIVKLILGIYLDSSKIDQTRYGPLINLLSIVNPLLDMAFIIGIIAMAGGIIYAAFMFTYGDERQKGAARSVLMGALLAGIILTLLGPLIAYFIGEYATWSLFGPPANGNWVPTSVVRSINLVISFLCHIG